MFLSGQRDLNILILEGLALRHRRRKPTLEKRRGLSKLLISFPLKEEGEKKEDFEVVFFSLHPKSEQFKLVIILRYEEREIERRK